MHQLERGHDGAARHAGAGDDLGHFLLGALGRPGGDGLIDGLAIRAACRGIGHAWIAEQVLAADRLHQAAPVILVAARGEDIGPVVDAARRALVEAARRRPRHRVAAARQLGVHRGLAAHRRAAVVQHRIAHGDLDVLAAAGRHALVERGDDAHGGQHPGAGVADRRARPHRRLVGMAIDAHRPAHRLGDHVERQVVGVRALRREALDLDEDQPRVERVQARPVEAQAGEGARRHVLHQDVGLLDHPPQQRLALLALEVAGHAALVEVVVDEIGRIGVGPIGHAPTPRLAAIGLLDLDDVGAEPRQRLGAGRPRLELGEVEHLDSLERRRGRGFDLRLH